MKYFSELLVVLLSALFTLNEAHYVEIPTDMLYPCQMREDYNWPMEERQIQDTRLKRQQKISIGNRVENLKRICAADLGIPSEEVPEDLMNVVDASPKIKCLITCILQRMELMTKKNRVSIRSIAQLADEVGNHNPLITSIAMALAEQFNQRLTVMQLTDQCEIGYLINQYIAKEMKDRKLQLPY